MDDVRSLLERAAGPVAPVDDQTLDTDLARGRRALRRHRVRLVASPVLGAMVIAAVGYGVLAGDVPATDTPVAGADEEEVAVQLVTFTGEVSGYEVAAVPDGWTVQGATPGYMTIAPKGADDTDPSSFVGKLLVALRSVDETGTPAGEQVTVGGKTGHIDRTHAGTTVLIYTDRGGQEVRIQVPHQLGWGNEDVIAFAEGVVVTGAAVPGRG